MKTLKANYRKDQDQITISLARFHRIQRTRLLGVLPIIAAIAISSMFAGCKKDSEENIVSSATPVDQYTITQAISDEAQRNTIAFNILHILGTDQINMFVARAQNQIDQINAFAQKRFPLLNAFRRLKEGDIPSGTNGLSKDAIMGYAAEIYRIDGQISYDRAKLFGTVVNSFTTEQKAKMDALKALNGVGNWESSLSNPLEGLK